MAKYADRVKETTTTVGVNDLTLAGAVSGFRRLQDAFALNDYVRYTLLDANGTAWESGYGKLTALTTLTREFILDSSTGSKITLSAGTHTVLIGAHPEMRKTEGVLTTLAVSGGIANNTWTDVTIGWVVPGSPPNKYDTSGILPSPGPHTSLAVPAWVSRIRVNALLEFYANGAGSAGMKYLAMTHLDNSWDSNGMGRDSQPSTTDATNVWQILRFATGIIDVPDQGGHGFKIRAYHNTGVVQDTSRGWLAVEFVE